MTDVQKLIDFKRKMYVKFKVIILNSDMTKLYRITIKLGFAVFS
jgi:hypothetical protein